MGESDIDMAIKYLGENAEMLKAYATNDPYRYNEAGGQYRLALAVKEVLTRLDKIEASLNIKK